MFFLLFEKKGETSVYFNFSFIEYGILKFEKSKDINLVRSLRPQGRCFTRTC